MLFEAQSTWTVGNDKIQAIGELEFICDHKNSIKEINDDDCPYELFAGALGGCLINTFLVIAERKRIRPIEVQMNTTISIKLKGEKFRIQSISLAGFVIVPKESVGISKGVLEHALDYCPLISLVNKTGVFSSDIEINPAI